MPYARSDSLHIDVKTAKTVWDHTVSVPDTRIECTVRIQYTSDVVLEIAAPRAPGPPCAIREGRSERPALSIRGRGRERER